MLDAIASLIGSITGLSSAGVLAALGAAIAAAIGLAYAKGRGAGKAAGAADTLNRTDDGRQAVARRRSSGDTPDETVRKNDGAWQ